MAATISAPPKPVPAPPPPAARRPDLLVGLPLLDRLIWGELLPKLFLGVALFSLLFLVAGPLLAAARFLSSGWPFWVVAAFVGWNFTGFIALTFPLGMMIAALLGFERLSKDSEAVALFAGGVSFPRMMVPVFALGLLVSLVSYQFNDKIASYANLQKANILARRDQLFGETSKPFDFVNRDDKDHLQITVHIEKGYDPITKTLRQVTITTYDTSGHPALITYAERAQSLGRGLKTWRLFNGTATSLGGTVPFRAETPDGQTYDLDKTSDNMDILRRDPETLNFRDLQTQIRQLKAQGKNSKEIRNLEVGLWFKTSIPFACLIFGLVGAPLGMRSPRQARFGGAVWALPIMLGYYVVYTSLSSIAQGGGIAPLLAAWVPNILGILVAAGLIWKASR